MPRRARQLAVVVALGALCLAAGCVHKETDGGTTTVTMETWTKIASVLGGLVALPAGIALRKQSTRGTVILIIAGVALLFFVAPMTFLDYVKIDDKHFEAHTGLWFAPKVHNIPFDDMAGVHLRKEITRGRRGRKRESFYLDIRRKSGATESVTVNNLLDEAAEEFVMTARAHNVPISGGDLD